MKYKAANGGGRSTYKEDRGWGQEIKGEVVGGYLSIYTPTPEYLRLREVYRDWVHIDIGWHLGGVIAGGAVCQTWWQELSVIPEKRYNPLREGV